MEGMQATDGSRYFNGALQGVVKQAAGEDSLEDRLRLKRAGARAARREQGIQKPGGNPFALGRNSLDGKSAIPAASTGSQRGSLLSAAPIPKTRPRKVPDENAQAGPSNSRPEAQIIAGSRKKLNLNQIETSEEDWVIQGDSAPHTRWADSHQDMDAGSSHYQQTPRPTRGSLQRTDGGHHPPPIYARSGGRGRSTATNSRSASPTKKNSSNRRLSNADAPYEEEEQIEDPEGFFPDDEIVIVERPGHPPAKATNPSSVFTGGVAEGTRAGSARRSTPGSASPQRATTGHVDSKGKGKAVNHDTFPAPEPIFKPRPTSKSTGSTSPMKPISAVGHSDSKGKGQSPERGYIEIDEHLASGEEKYDHHPLPAPPTKKSVIPTSGLSHNVLMCCNTQVVWCVDLKGEKRRIKVRQVELHSDGIVLGDSNVRRFGLYISLSNISGTESCERPACPFIVLNVKTKLSKTKVDSDRLKSLLLPGITENSRRPPTEDEMSTLRFFIHLESDANSEDFIQTHRQLTEFLTYGMKFRLSRQDCEGHRAVGPKPIRDDAEAPAAAKHSVPLAAKNQELGRAPDPDSALPRQRVRPSVELPSRRPTAKQSARPREKDKERDFEPPKAKPSKIAKLAKTIFDMVPSRQSKRLSGSKTNGSEAEDLCSEDEVIPEPPKTPALAPPPDRGTVLFPYPLTGRATLNITKGELWRVMSGEFLNDTLIEWGLQLLLSDLKGAKSESDIHLFNSFFYTKMSCKDRDKKLQTRTESTEARWPAYETIRKWTKSVDVFSKKFIIVPINEEYHWYLAVIYNPGLMLVQPPADTLPSPKDEVEPSPCTNVTPDINDENDVDAELGSAREESNPDAPNSIMAAPNSDEPMDGSHVADESVDELDCIERSPPVTKMKELEIGARPRIRRPPPPGRPISDSTLDAVQMQNENHASSSRAEELVSKPEPIKPVTVKAERPPDHVILDSQKPWIITFDSLGASHRAVGNNLAQWLQWEARDKKGGNYDHVQVEYTHAQVPLQTNFSDCGLYLVHYARQLLNNPETVLKFVERRLPRKDSDERKQFAAELDTIWGISRDHTLRDEWQAKINSLKEQYEGQKVEKPADETPNVPENDNVVTEGDSGEGFLDDVNPGNMVVTDLPVLENPAGLEDDRMDGHGDPIEAEKSTGILGTTATAEDQPQSNINDKDTTVAQRERSPRPHDSEQDTHIASEANSAMAEQSEEWSDELESDGDEAPKANSPPTGTIAEPRPLVEPYNQGRGGSPSGVQEEELAEDDAISSVLTESTIFDDTGDSQAPESNREVDEYDAVDPELGNFAPERSRPTTYLEDEGTELEPDECYATLPNDADAGSGNPISSQASVESLRLIKNAGLVHDTNPGPSRIPGKSAEEAIDVSTDEEDNATTAHVPPHIHTTTEIDIPVSATPTTSRNSTLFKGLTPSSASARKTAVENRQSGTSPLTSVATSKGDAELVPPSFRPDSRCVVEASAPSSPLTPADTDFGEVEHVQPPSRAEITSGRGKAKKAPPAARASFAPWQNDQLKGDALHARGGRKNPVSGRRKFADLDSDSSAGTTFVRPVTQVYPSMMEGKGSGARQDAVQSGPMPIPMARSNSGGLGTLNDPEPTSVKRHMSLDRSRASQDRSSQSGTPVLGPDSKLPSIEDDTGSALNDTLQEKPNKPDTSTSSQVSPAKQPKTLDTRNPVRQNRKRPSNITTKDQEMEMDDVESRDEAASLPEHLTCRQLNTVSSSSVSAPVSRLQPRSSTSEIVLTEENGRPIILDTREGQYEAEPWLPQNLLDRSEDAGPSTSISAPPFQRKTKRNTSTAMPQEEEEYFALLDKNGNVDNLESRSDEDFVPKQPRRSSRHNTTSPQAPQGTHIATSSTSSDGIQFQNELDGFGLGKRQPLGQSVPRPVTYGAKGKKKQQDPQKPHSASHQSKLNFASPAPSNDYEAGPSTATRKFSANQKRQNDSPDSAATAKKKKFEKGAPGHTPGRQKRAVAVPRKGKSKESGLGHNPIDISDSD